MDNNNKDNKNWLDGRNEALPEGFWESVKPHIPVYKRKRRVLFILWFGFILLGLLIYGVGVNFHNYSSDKIEKNITQSSKQKPLSEKNQNLNFSPFDNVNESNIIHQIPTTNDEQNIPTLKSNSFFNNKNKTVNSTYDKNNKYTGNINKLSNSENSIYTKSSKSDYDVNHQYDVSLKEKELVENHALKLKVEIEPIHPIKFNFENKHDFKLELQKINLIKSERKYISAHFGYNLLLLFREMNSINIDNPTFHNRQKYERDYISHEFFGDIIYRIHDRWSIGGGLRYSRIQELFDYNYQTVEGHALQAITKTRIIDHTNTIDLVDIYGRVEYHFTLSNFRFLVSNNIAYNINLNAKGFFLKETNLLDQLENAHFYKTNIGWSNQISLGIRLPINNNFSIDINGGYRYYFNAWSNPDSDLTMKYKGFSLGSGLVYSLQR